jgi:hypothetical protein
LVSASPANHHEADAQPDDGKINAATNNRYNRRGMRVRRRGCSFGSNDRGSKRPRMVHKPVPRNKMN